MISKEALVTPTAPTRRSILAGVGAAALAGPLGGRAFAQTPKDHKFVLIILRGGLDGLAATPPVGDPNYRRLRAELAFSPDQVFDAGDGFGIHPSMTTTHALYQAGEAAFIPAAHPGYSTRSHFDAQDLLEAGVTQLGDAHDGWLNRALQVTDPRDAMAIGTSIPPVLQGPAPATSWAPNILPEVEVDTVARLNQLYMHDELLGAAFESGLRADAIAGDMMSDRAPARQNFAETTKSAARFMTAPGGTGAVVLSLGGWDTHFAQGVESGRLANSLTQLDNGIAMLKQELGPVWERTVVIAASEFGRTARANGTRGTDHGTGGTVFLYGGAINGGRIHGDWPGLGELHEGRDVKAANDMRGIFKGVLSSHWGVDRVDLDRRVFPDSADAPAVQGLVQSWA